MVHQRKLRSATQHKPRYCEACSYTCSYTSAGRHLLTLACDQAHTLVQRKFLNRRHSTGKGCPSGGHVGHCPTRAPSGRVVGPSLLGQS